MTTKISNRTYLAKPGEVTSLWQHFDADGVVLGRLASRIALVLQGKHRPEYTPHVDTGDHVVVTNAEKVLVSGRKEEQNIHRYHSGYIGGLKEVALADMRERHPDRIIELAVRRMLPKTKLGRAMIKKLKIYAGADHPHQAQQPVAVDTTPYKPKR